MFEIVLTACALATPSVCETHYIATSAPHELACMMEIQPTIARQRQQGLFDPDSWRIASFGCERS